MSRQSTGKIYFMQIVPDGAIKIGFSTHPRRRLKQIRATNPDPVRLLGTVPGTVYHEKALHVRLKAHRVNGEWFRPSPLVQRFVGRCLRRRSTTIRIDRMVETALSQLVIDGRAPSRRGGRTHTGPRWWPGRQGWYTCIGGKQYLLAKGIENRSVAVEKYSLLMAALKPGSPVLNGCGPAKNPRSVAVFWAAPWLD